MTLWTWSYIGTNRIGQGCLDSKQSKCYDEKGLITPAWKNAYHESMMLVEGITGHLRYEVEACCMCTFV